MMAQLSMGLKHSKKEDDQDAVPVGLVMPWGSLETADARATQPSISCCISDFGAAIVVKDQGTKYESERATGLEASIDVETDYLLRELVRWWMKTERKERPRKTSYTYLTPFPQSLVVNKAGNVQPYVQFYA